MLLLLFLLLSSTVLLSLVTVIVVIVFGQDHGNHSSTDSNVNMTPVLKRTGLIAEEQCRRLPLCTRHDSETWQGGSNQWHEKPI
jgi:hypothetical protein